MPKYTIYATIVTQLETEIEADNYDEAYRIADYELITGDFEAVNSEFTLGLVIEAKK